jgi:hypothetical protein
LFILFQEKTTTITSKNRRRKGGCWAGLVIKDSRQILLAVALCLVGEKKEFKRAILSIKTKKMERVKSWSIRREGWPCSIWTMAMALI